MPEFCRCCGSPLSGSCLNPYGSDHCEDCYCEQFEEQCEWAFYSHSPQLMLWSWFNIDFNV